jgi:serine/threonine protein kinase
MALSVGTRIGAYEILQFTGAGGMGQVYRARDTRLNRDVAIKLLPDSFLHDHDPLARFRREAQLLASLNHPDIATIHGFEETDGVRALVMEFVEGRTLAELIAATPTSQSGVAEKLSLAEALSIARQIAEALETAHEHGIIHRDPGGLRQFPPRPVTTNADSEHGGESRVRVTTSRGRRLFALDGESNTSGALLRS